MAANLWDLKFENFRGWRRIPRERKIETRTLKNHILRNMDQAIMQVGPTLQWDTLLSNIIQFRKNKIWKGFLEFFFFSIRILQTRREGFQKSFWEPRVISWFATQHYSPSWSNNTQVGDGKNSKIFGGLLGDPRMGGIWAISLKDPTPGDTDRTIIWVGALALLHLLLLYKGWLRKKLKC